jgi:hypothetical protein
MRIDPDAPAAGDIGTGGGSRGAIIAGADGAGMCGGSGAET